jgi:hypothetical protein
MVRRWATLFSIDSLFSELFWSDAVTLVIRFFRNYKTDPFENVASAQNLRPSSLLAIWCTSEAIQESTEWTGKLRKGWKIVKRFSPFDSQICSDENEKTIGLHFSIFMSESFCCFDVCVVKLGNLKRPPDFLEARQFRFGILLLKEHYLLSVNPQTKTCNQWKP